MKNKLCGLVVLMLAFSSSSPAFAVTFTSKPMSPAVCMAVLHTSITKIRAKYKVKETDSLSALQLNEAKIPVTRNCDVYLKTEDAKFVKKPVPAPVAATQPTTTPAPATPAKPVTPAAVAPVAAPVVATPAAATPAAATPVAAAPAAEAGAQAAN